MFLPSEQTDLMVHGGSFQQADTRQPTHPLLRYQSGSPSGCEHSHKMLWKKKDTGKSEVGIKVQRLVIMYFIHLSTVVLYFSSWPFHCKNTLLCIYLPYILLKLSKQSAPDLDSLKLLFTFTSGAPSTNTVIQTRAIYVVLLPLPINNLFELQKVARGQFTGKASAVGRLTRLKGRKKILYTGPALFWKEVKQLINRFKLKSFSQNSRILLFHVDLSSFEAAVKDCWLRAVFLCLSLSNQRLIRHFDSLAELLTMRLLLPVCNCARKQLLQLWRHETAKVTEARWRKRKLGVGDRQTSRWGWWWRTESTQRRHWEPILLKTAERMMGEFRPTSPAGNNLWLDSDVSFIRGSRTVWWVLFSVFQL